jgi:hypothetical protein
MKIRVFENDNILSSIKDKPLNIKTISKKFVSKIPKDKKFKVENLFEFKRVTGDLTLSIIFLMLVSFLLISFNTESGWDGRELSQKRVGKILKQQWVGPLICMVILVPATIYNLYQSTIQLNINKRLRMPSRIKHELFQWLKSLEFIFYFLIYTNIITIFGYLISTVIFAIFLTTRLGYRSLEWILRSAIAAFIIVIIFRSILQIKTPVNIWLYKFLPQNFEVFMKIYF